VVFAQTQVGTVTSSAPFTLRGNGVTPGGGVPNWPLMAGDNFASGSAIVTVEFKDCGTIQLAPNSKGKVEFENGKPVFRLTDGAAKYDLKKQGCAALFALNQPVNPSALSGGYNLGGQAAAAAAKAAGWTATKTILVVGAAGAAGGIAAGVAAANSEPSSVSGR